MPFRRTTHLPIGGVLSWKRLISDSRWISKNLLFIHRWCTYAVDGELNLPHALAV